MKSVHLVIPDLFLPQDIAVEVCAGLRLPALEKLLARGASTVSARTGAPGLPLENLLCELFAVPCAVDAPIAPISAAFDGLPAGCWMRADPVNLRLQREKLLLSGVQVSREESVELCASLNRYFAGQGMEFFAPHPQRWYLRLAKLPRIKTTPLSAVLGGNVRGALPTGEDAARWHSLFNEMQMLLFAHPANQAREERGEATINSVWLWGVGESAGTLAKAFDSVISDELMVEMLASATASPFAVWAERWDDTFLLDSTPDAQDQLSSDGRQLLVWTGLRSALQHGDLAAWRDALQGFEVGYAQPLWRALRSGKLGQVRLDILGEAGLRSVRLERAATWDFWRRSQRLADYSLR